MANNPHEAVICILTKKHAPDPFEHPVTVDGFQNYLRQLGVVHFTADEMVTPHNTEAAEKAGYKILLPLRHHWSKGGACALMADRLRVLVGDKVKLRNWWRPPEYNRLVGGASASDHISASAIDLDFRKRDHRRKAELWLMDLYRKDLFELSLGLGGQSIHLGCFSPGGKRLWKYKSYKDT